MLRSISECPASISECPASISECPASISECPAGLSECPARISECPAGISECPASISECPASVSECPASVSECPRGHSDDGAAIADRVDVEEGVLYVASNWSAICATCEPGSSWTSEGFSVMQILINAATQSSLPTRAGGQRRAGRRISSTERPTDNFSLLRLDA
jgi:hypothetical protein